MDFELTFHYVSCVFASVSNKGGDSKALLPVTFPWICTCVIGIRWVPDRSRNSRVYTRSVLSNLAQWVEEKKFTRFRGTFVCRCSRSESRCGKWIPSYYICCPPFDRHDLPHLFGILRKNKSRYVRSTSASLDLCAARILCKSFSRSRNRSVRHSTEVWTHFAHHSKHYLFNDTSVRSIILIGLSSREK